MKRRATMMIIIAIVVVLAILSYVLAPYIDAYRANGHLDIAGVKLLMTYSDVEEVLGKGTSIGGFGAEYYTYENEAITIAYPTDGLLENRVGQIETSNQRDSIFGIHPGDSLDDAKLILTKYGFKQDYSDKNFFKRGSIWIYVFGDSIRINIEDWTIKDRIY